MSLAPLSMRQNPVAGYDYSELEPKTVTVQDKEPEFDKDQAFIKIENDDGSVIINIGTPKSTTEKKDEDFHENLAMHVDSSTLSGIGSELCRLIEQDDNSRQEWLNQYVMGLDLLGTKLEKATNNAADGSTAVEGQSTVRHPLLLEAVVRFQANARGEMLPSTGPAKVRMDGYQDEEQAVQALAFQQDFNHYLTVTAKEYYPDTERMHFSLGFCGIAFKKVYHCPLRRRPVSEFVDVKDIIVSNAETSIQSTPRFTHSTKMSPSTLKRLQLLGVYRNTPMTNPQPPKKNIVDEKIDDLQGVKPTQTSQIEQEMREIYECYCELDLPGYEHEDENGPTGLSLPYRVTIDKTSKEILEIRRWWREDDENYLRREVLVDYHYIPGFGFYSLGLLHLLGNLTMSLTAGLRLCIDNGMFANFPGFLFAKQAGRQNTNEFRVAPGSGVGIETNGEPISSVVSPLPYRGVDGAFLQLLELIADNGERLGGTADLNVGEGNAEAPVGTTIALLEQAQKVMSAVHKRMHAAQMREFELLRDLFKEDPKAFWRDNKMPVGTWSEEILVKALENVNIVPCSDPNTPSQTSRIQKAMALKQLQAANPTLYDPKAVDMRILNMFGIDDAESLFAPPPAPPDGPPPPDPMMIQAQAKMLDAQAHQAEVKVKALAGMADAQNHQADRESKERIAQLQVAREIAVHPESAPITNQFLKPALGALAKNPNV